MRAPARLEIEVFAYRRWHAPPSRMSNRAHPTGRSKTEQGGGRHESAQLDEGLDA
jgi:hypothetical protein